MSVHSFFKCLFSIFLKCIGCHSYDRNTGFFLIFQPSDCLSCLIAIHVRHLDVSVTGLHFHPFCPQKGIYILNESTSYNLFILSVILSIILDQCNIFYICDLPDLLCEIKIILPTEYLNCHLCFLPTHRL